MPLAVAQFGFEIAVLVLEGDPLVSPAKPKDGEARWMGLGKVEGKLYATVYTERFDHLRIISVRRASSKERRMFDARPE